jgi:uncharacterized protein (TIGR02145 family)
MQKNLEVSFFKNGEPINQVLNSGDWANACDSNEPAWAYYNYNAANAGYGKLYNWYAVNDSRGLAPSGWRIPLDNDFDTLASNLGGYGIVGKHMKESGTSHWDSANGDNSSQFTSLGAGYIDDAGDMHGFKNSTGYWTSQDSGSDALLYEIDDTTDVLSNFNVPKCYGFSVRCIKN